MEVKKIGQKQPIPKSAKKVFNGVVFDVYQWEQELFDGSKTTFEKLKRPGTAVIIALDEDRNFILTDQKQPGREKSFLGNPAGRIDEGENPLEGAKRELLEETGYVSEDWEIWFTKQPHTKIDWTIFIFIARKCKKVVEQNLDAGEKIDLKFVDFQEYQRLVLNKEISSIILEKFLFAKIYPEKMQEIKEIFFKDGESKI